MGRAHNKPGFKIPVETVNRISPGAAETKRREGVSMAKMNKVDESQRLDTLDGKGNWVYPSGSESGHVQIEIPTLPGSPNTVERLHARDFGPYVVRKIESAMSQQGYMRSGPQQDSAQVFRHYTSVARGAKLMDENTLRQMERLAGEFEGESAREEFFSMVLRPYLHSLTPGRR
jgi:hypothetical protein